MNLGPLLFLVLAIGGSACAPRALQLSATHPARADAPTAPLSVPSSTLRPGVAGDVFAEPPPPEPGTGSGGHAGHGSTEESP